MEISNVYKLVFNRLLFSINIKIYGQEIIIIQFYRPNKDDPNNDEFSKTLQKS